MLFLHYFPTRDLQNKKIITKICPVHRKIWTFEISSFKMTFDAQLSNDYKPKMYSLLCHVSYTIFFPECSGKIMCKKTHYHFCFTRVLVENVVVLVNFGTFWPITFYVNIKSENFVNESCLSRRTTSFNIDIDGLLCFWTTFEFSVWHSLQRKQRTSELRDLDFRILHPWLHCLGPFLEK